MTTITSTLYDVARAEVQERHRQADKRAQVRLAIRLTSGRPDTTPLPVQHQSRNGVHIFRALLRRTAQAA